jgi:hypothetical protein
MRPTLLFPKAALQKCRSGVPVEADSESCNSLLARYFYKQ